MPARKIAAVKESDSSILLKSKKGVDFMKALVLDTLTYLFLHACALCVLVPETAA